MTENSGNIKESLEEFVKQALQSYAEAQGVTLPKMTILIERPKVKEFGDFASNAAMQTVKIFKKNPMEIAEGIKERIPPSPLIGEISIATGEQTLGISQVGEAVMQLDQVTQQNAALVEQSAAADDSLKHQAARLSEIVSVFRLGR